jgi:hypothetical protein
MTEERAHIEGQHIVIGLILEVLAKRKLTDLATLERRLEHLFQDRPRSQAPAKKMAQRLLSAYLDRSP